MLVQNLQTGEATRLALGFIGQSWLGISLTPPDPFLTTFFLAKKNTCSLVQNGNYVLKGKKQYD